MSAETNYSAHAEVPAAPSEGHEGSPGLLDVSFPLMALTWAAFVVMSVILYKVAWKPILNALDMREQTIRKAAEDAEKARAELATLEARGREILAAAERESREMLAATRASADEMLKAAEKRAGDEATALVANARQEIQAATEQARTVLRAESAELAIALSGRLIGENMDSTRNRTLIEKLSKEL